MSSYNWDTDPRPVCIIPDGGFSSLEQIENCKIPQNYFGTLISFKSQIVDKHGHILEGDSDPKSKNGCDHRETPEWKAEHKVKQKKVIQSEEIKTKEIIEVPSVPIEKPPEVKKVDGIASMPMLMGAIAGVVSSAAGPFFGNLVKNFLNKKVLKNNSKQEDNSPTDCKTSQIKFITRFGQLETRISKLESEDNSQFSFGSDEFEDLINRIEKLEKKKKKG